MEDFVLHVTTTLRAISGELMDCIHPEESTLVNDIYDNILKKLLNIDDLFKIELNIPDICPAIGIETRLSFIKQEFYETEAQIKNVEKDEDLQLKKLETLKENIYDANKLIDQCCKDCSENVLVVSEIFWLLSTNDSILDDFLNDPLRNKLFSFIETILKCFLKASKNEAISNEEIEFKCVVALIGIMSNVSSRTKGRLFLLDDGKGIFKKMLKLLYSFNGNQYINLQWLVFAAIYNLTVNFTGFDFIKKNKKLMSIMVNHRHASNLMLSEVVDNILSHLEQGGSFKPSTCSSSSHDVETCKQNSFHVQKGIPRRTLDEGSCSDTFDPCFARKECLRISPEESLQSVDMCREINVKDYCNIDIKNHKTPKVIRNRSEIRLLEEVDNMIKQLYETALASRSEAGKAPAVKAENVSLQCGTDSLVRNLNNLCNSNQSQEECNCELLSNFPKVIKTSKGSDFSQNLVQSVDCYNSVHVFQCNSYKKDDKSLESSSFLAVTREESFLHLEMPESGNFDIEDIEEIVTSSKSSLKKRCIAEAKCSSFYPEDHFQSLYFCMAPISMKSVGIESYESCLFKETLESVKSDNAVNRPFHQRNISNFGMKVKSSASRTLKPRESNASSGKCTTDSKKSKEEETQSLKRRRPSKKDTLSCSGTQVEKGLLQSQECSSPSVEKIAKQPSSKEVRKSESTKQSIRSSLQSEERSLNSTVSKTSSKKGKSNCKTDKPNSEVKPCSFNKKPKPSLISTDKVEEAGEEKTEDVKPEESSGSVSIQKGKLISGSSLTEGEKTIEEEAKSSAETNEEEAKPSLDNISSNECKTEESKIVFDCKRPENSKSTEDTRASEAKEIEADVRGNISKSEVSDIATVDESCSCSEDSDFEDQGIDQCVGTTDSCGASTEEMLKEAYSEAIEAGSKPCRKATSSYEMSNSPKKCVEKTVCFEDMLPKKCSSCTDSPQGSNSEDEIEREGQSVKDKIARLEVICKHIFIKNNQIIEDMKRIIELKTCASEGISSRSENKSG